MRRKKGGEDESDTNKYGVNLKSPIQPKTKVRFRSHEECKKEIQSGVISMSSDLDFKTSMPKNKYSTTQSKHTIN